MIEMKEMEVDDDVGLLQPPDLKHASTGRGGGIEDNGPYQAAKSFNPTTTMTTLPSHDVEHGVVTPCTLTGTSPPTGQEKPIDQDATIERGIDTMEVERPTRPDTYSPIAPTLITESPQWPALTVNNSSMDQRPTNDARARLQRLYDQRQPSLAYSTNATDKNAHRINMNTGRKTSWLQDNHKHQQRMNDHLEEAQHANMSRYKRSAGVMNGTQTPPRSNQIRHNRKPNRVSKIVCEKVKSSIPMSKSYDNTSSEDVILQIRTRLTQEEKRDRVNIYGRVTQLAAKLLSLHTIVILPFDPKTLLPILSQAQHIPASSEQLLNYCTTWHINQTNTTLFYQIRVKIQDQKFSQFKKGLIGWLDDHGVYMNTTKLTTSRNCVIGWLLHTHHVITNRESTAKELHKRCNLMKPIQVIPRTITNELTHIKTKALAIECGIADAREIEQGLLKGLTDVIPGQKYNSTAKMLYVPMRASPEITDDMICECIQKQEEIIETMARIKLENVHGLDNTLSHPQLCPKGKPLREYFVDHIDGISTVDVGVTHQEVNVFIHHCDFHQVLHQLQELNLQLKQANVDYKLYDLDYYTVKHREGLVTSTLKQSYASILSGNTQSYQPRDNTSLDECLDTSIYESNPRPQATEHETMYNYHPTPQASTYQNTDTPNDPTKHPSHHQQQQKAIRSPEAVPKDITWEDWDHEQTQPSSPQASKVTAETKHSEITLSTVMSHVTHLQQEMTQVLKQCAATQKQVQDQNKTNQENFQKMLALFAAQMSPSTPVHPSSHLAPINEIRPVPVDENQNAHMENINADVPMLDSTSSSDDAVETNILQVSKSQPLTDPAL